MEFPRPSLKNLAEIGIGAAGGALAVAAVTGRIQLPQDDGLTYTQRIEGRIDESIPLGNDRKLDIVIIDGKTPELDEQLINNGGANVRSFPDINGAILGKIPAGAKFGDAILTSGMGGDWVAAKCDNMPFDFDPTNVQLPMDDNGFPIFPEVCFVNGDLAQSTNK